jgi:glycosyltransferase involved in cell wall biosynthesis
MSAATERTPLLFHSNAPWVPTGYGQQTGLFTPKLNERYDVGISCLYGLEGARLGWNGMMCYPGIAPDCGDRFLQSHAKAHFGGDLRGGIVMTLFDVWAMNPARVRTMNVCSWVPVDHEPAPPPVKDFFRNSGAVPIAMSRFGEKQLEEFDPLYVPHGIETDVYKPIPQEQARDLTKIPQGKFIVGMVAANKGNPSRKCFAEAFEAFKAFHDSQPDAVLYLHTELTGKAANGVDLSVLLNALNIPRDAVLFADQDRVLFNPIGPDSMAAVYSSMDVLLAPSAGEGFGIPVLEANACGVPAIVTDFTAQPEVCGSGWKVSHTPNWTGIGSWQAHPSIPDILDALKKSYRLKQDDRLREQYRDRAREHALGYDADLVMAEYMLPALEEVERRFAAREPKTLKAAA